MIRRTASISAVCGLLAAGLVGATGPAASAAPGAVLGTRADFNDPDSKDKKERTRLRDRMKWLIEGTPSDTTIRMTQFRLRDEQITGALIAAAKKGVTVQVLVDYGTWSDPNFKKLAAELKKHEGSWAKECGKDRSCNYDHAMHNKFTLFGATRGAKQVVVTGTANFSHFDRVGAAGWNSLYTDVGNAGLFRRYGHYFDDLERVADGGAPNPNYYDQFPPEPTGDTKSYFYPRAKGSGKKRDPIVNTLDAVKCHSSWGPTKIRIGMWSISRTGVAGKLSELAGRGCKVYVIVNQIQPEACERLIEYRPDPWGEWPLPPLPPRRVQLKVDGDEKRGVHTKDMAIGGWYVRNETRAVFTGSQNYNYTSLRHNDENTLRIMNNKTVYNAYVGNLSKMWHATDRPVVKDCTPERTRGRTETAPE